MRVEKFDAAQGQTITWEGQAVSATGIQKVKIHAESLGVFKQPKVIIFKKTQRHTYKRKTGHRQQLVWAKITDVVNA